MKKSYIQPEFDLLKLSSSDDILGSIPGVTTDDGSSFEDVDSFVEDALGGGESWE